MKKTNNYLLIKCNIFIYLSVNFICYESVKQKVDCFIKGFYSVLPYDYIKIFTPEEFDFLLSGQTNIDLQDWRKHTIYKGYYDDNYPVKIL
jgi:E3 ubiquitin-protein ligase NEDD4-like